MTEGRHTIVLDWDGTLVPAAWPDQPTELLPGAVEALRAFHRKGFKLLVFSARLSPYDPYTSQPRHPALVAGEVQYVRDTLDRHGLPYVDIWTLPGKPSGSVYVDDKAERYGGRPGSWAKLTEKILMRLNAEDAPFPAFDFEEVPAT